MSPRAGSPNHLPVPLRESSSDTERKITRSLNPLAVVGRLVAKKKEAQTGHLGELAAKVTAKALGDIAEKGMVTVFRDRQTRELTVAIYSVYLTSEVLPHLDAHIWREWTEDHRQRRLDQPKAALTILELDVVGQYKPNRMTLHVGRHQFRPSEPPVSFSRGWNDEGQSNPISYTDKARFLEEILATEVDVAATERKFGFPYSPGGTRTSRATENWENADTQDTNISGWVRDLREGLPILYTDPMELGVVE